MKRDSEIAKYHHNTIAQDLEAVRPKSLKRIIAFDQVIAYEVDRSGPVFEEWVTNERADGIDPSLANFVQALEPRHYRELVEGSAIDILPEDDAQHLFDVSDRTVRDTIRTVQHFNLPL